MDDVCTSDLVMVEMMSESLTRRLGESRDLSPVPFQGKGCRPAIGYESFCSFLSNCMIIQSPMSPMSPMSTLAGFAYSK